MGQKISELSEKIDAFSGAEMLALSHAGTSYRAAQSLVGGQHYSTAPSLTGGQWLGKPIWRVVVDTGALPNNTQKVVASGISGVDWIVALYGIAKSASVFISLPFVHSNTTYLIRIDYNLSSNEIRLSTSNDLTVYGTSYVVLEYTLT